MEALNTLSYWKYDRAGYKSYSFTNVYILIMMKRETALRIHWNLLLSKKVLVYFFAQNVLQQLDTIITMILSRSIRVILHNDFVISESINRNCLIILCILFWYYLLSILIR